MSIKIIFLCAFFLCTSITFSQPPGLEWLGTIGNLNGFPNVTGIAEDKDGNIIFCGQFHNTIDFDFSSSTYEVFSNTSSTFVAKYSPDRDLIWVQVFNGAFGFQTSSLNVDDNGNIILGGKFNLTYDSDPGPGIYEISTSGDLNAYIVRLDPSGNFLNATHFGDNGDLWVDRSTVDSLENVYTIGSFYGLIDYDQGPGVYNVGSVDTTGVFIQKTDSANNFVWAVEIASADDSINVWDIDVDPFGNVFVSGYFNGMIDFDPGASVEMISAMSGQHGFLIKLDSSGNYKWARTLGNNSTTRIYGLDTDDQGNVYGSGIYYNTVDFDPGASTLDITSTDSEDGFIWKLDSLGDLVWVKAYGGTNQDRPLDIHVHSSGVYVTGTFSGNMDADASSGIASLNSTHLFDIFILKYDFAGNFEWAHSFSGIGGWEQIDEILATNDGVYICGTYSDSTDFSGLGTQYLVPVGNWDIFLAKYSGVLDNGNVMAGNLISVYPNPTNGNVTLDLGNLNSSSTIMLYNNQGQIVYEEIILSEQIVNLNLSLNPGSYYLSVTNDSRNFIEKIIVLN